MICSRTKQNLAQKKSDAKRRETISLRRRQRRQKMRIRRLEENGKKVDEDSALLVEILADFAKDPKATEQ